MYFNLFFYKYDSGELGYNLIKSLRGRTSGRKLKRTIFKFGIIQLICGTSLTVITILACM